MDPFVRCAVVFSAMHVPVIDEDYTGFNELEICFVGLYFINVLHMETYLPKVLMRDWTLTVLGKKKRLKRYTNTHSKFFNDSQITKCLHEAFTWICCNCYIGQHSKKNIYVRA